MENVRKAGVIVVCGATASSKTKLAVAIAEKLHTEVISADSMLVYRGLDIGTAKPAADEMRGVKHHLIDVADPFDDFSVEDYRSLALPIVEELLSRGKNPVICGGTGFYIDALLYESAFGNAPACPEIRRKYEKYLIDYGKEEGARTLHNLLAEVDAESAKKLHVNDTKRVIRALEIYESTGKKKSEQTDEKKTPRFPFRAFCVDYPREVLYERINARVDKMFEAGLLSEVERLKSAGVTRDCQCMQGIGYKEIVEGQENGDSIEAISELIKRRTRNYAKRQITFFKRMDRLTRLSPDFIENDENLAYFNDLLFE